MRDLLAEYREETIAELLNIYAKSCLLKEYLHIFPFISKISFKDEYFYTYITKVLQEKYFGPVSRFIDTDQSFFDICKTAIIEIQQILEQSITGRPFDLVNDFPNIAFSSYETEKDAFNLYVEDSDKYKNDHFYREYYIRIEDAPLSTAIDDSERAFLSRPNYLKEVIRPSIFKEWMISIANTIPQHRFLTLVPNRFLGVRLVYNPSLTISENNKRSLFDAIHQDPKYTLQKTNAIGFLHNESLIRYTFPLIVAKKEIRFPPYLGSTLAMTEFVGTAQYDNEMFNLSNKLWDDPNFCKLFEYHFPVKLLQSILFDNFLKKYNLLHDVLVENKVFQDLSGTIINLLTRIKFAEDPTNI